MREKHKTPETENNFEYTMMFLVPHSEVTILPYHRLIKNIDTKLTDDFQDKIRQDFEVINSDNLTMPPRGSFGMNYENNYYFLTPKKRQSVLDVELLHKYLLEPFLELNEERIKAGDYVHYISGDKEISRIEYFTWKTSF